LGTPAYPWDGAGDGSCPPTRPCPTAFAVGVDRIKALQEERSSKSCCPVAFFSHQRGSAAAWVVFPRAHKKDQKRFLMTTGASHRPPFSLNSSAGAQLPAFL